MSPSYDMIIPWASYQIRKIAGCACAGNAGNIPPRRRFQSKSLVSDPGMHHGTCVTHVPWCMSGSLIRSDGENVPGIPGACAPAILCIWQEAHTERQQEGQNSQHILNKVSHLTFSDWHWGIHCVYPPGKMKISIVCDFKWLTGVSILWAQDLSRWEIME